MALSILKTLKKTSTTHSNVEKVSKLIWGPSLESKRMIQDWANEGITYKHLSSEQEIHFEAYCRYLRPIRGHANAELAQELGFQLGDGPFGGLFFKDQKFREFGGRSKSLPLLEGEDFFLREGWQLSGDSESRFELSSKATISNPAVKITYLEVDRHWRVELLNGDVVEAEEIFYSGNGHQLMKVWTNFPETLAKNIQAQGQNYKDRKIFMVNWISPNQVTDLRSTLYLPQSLTHDWGHFMGEFGPFLEGVGQSFSFFFFVDEEEIEAEGLTRKFQALKRVLAKVFPNQERAFLSDPTVGPFKETVMLMEDFSLPPLQINLQKIIGQIPLRWIGPFAPLTTEIEDFLRERNIEIGMVDGLVRDRLSSHSPSRSFCSPEIVRTNSMNENFHC